MSAVILPFEPPRPYVLVHSPGVLRSGDRYYAVDFYPAAAEGGGCVGMYESLDYRSAERVALDVAVGGIRIIDKVGVHS